jgi:hypothetical protein
MLVFADLSHTRRFDGFLGRSCVIASGTNNLPLDTGTAEVTPLRYVLRFLLSKGRGSGLGRKEKACFEPVFARLLQVGLSEVGLEVSHASRSCIPKLELGLKRIRNWHAHLAPE